MTKYKGYKLEHFYGKYGENVCYCKGAWFEDSSNNNDGCNENANSVCDVYKDIYAYKYIVLPIKKCVTECPEEFPYSFKNSHIVSMTNVLNLVKREINY